jgi:hypothetical protein
LPKVRVVCQGETEGLDKKPITERPFFFVSQAKNPKTLRRKNRKTSRLFRIRWDEVGGGKIRQAALGPEISDLSFQKETARPAAAAVTGKESA